MRHRARRKNRDLSIFLLICIVIVEIVILTVLFKIPAVKEKVEKRLIKGRIAIVLDDWGYNLKNLKSLKEIRYSLTIAVLPNLAYSKKIAQEAERQGKEVILHMPMQPHPDEDIGLELSTIKTDMPKDKIVSLLDNSIKSVPGIKGVSNHMGSKATEDEKLMGIILQELKRRRLYFLDSLVTPRSVCKKIANKIDLNFVERDVFLDNQEDAGYIKGQLRKLVSIAEENGSAIGIGHDRAVTLEVLKKEIPAIEKEGFSFVFLSELISK